MTAARALRGGVAGLWLAGALVGALFIAWRLLAAGDFLYPLFYDWAEIGETIAEYAPENRYREGFEHTPRAERERLFAAITDAIHHQGQGLATLTYHDADGRPLDRLLRAEEITHLRDVARLVDGFQRLGWAALALTAGLTALFFAMRWPLPAPRNLLGGLAIVLAATGLLLAVAGPVEVFYWLHERLFPPDHPWFFYYQDSLMSTMMRAPVLFGYIGAALAGLALVLLAGFLGFAYRLLGKRSAIVRG